MRSQENKEFGNGGEFQVTGSEGGEETLSKGKVPGERFVVGKDLLSLSSG